jgi:nucleoside-diphosphate-sugar epimerase
VEANILATRKNNFKGDVFNIAGGKNYTVLELVDILNRIIRKNANPLFLQPRQGDVFKTLADLSRTKKFLGYKPKVNFVEGLKLAVAYFKGAGY